MAGGDQFTVHCSRCKHQWQPLAGQVFPMEMGLMVRKLRAVRCCPVCKAPDKDIKLGAVPMKAETDEQKRSRRL